MITIFIAGISLGILGSFHCVGMCGPIAMTLPIHQYGAIKKYIRILVYNLGRAFTYSVLGLLFGLLGESFYIADFQQNFSILLGILVLLFVFFTYSKFSFPIKIPFASKGINKLKIVFAQLLGRNGIQFMFAIGLINGLLPCGLVYMALAGAVTTGSFANGALFMFSFGLGTIPIMFALMVFGQFIDLRYRNIMRQSVPFFVTAMALLLIVRGLNLGIPLVSPEIKQETVVNENKLKKHGVLKCCVNPKVDSVAVIKNSLTNNFVKTPEHNK